MLKDWNGFGEVTEVTEVTAFWGGHWKKFSHAQASGARRIDPWMVHRAIDMLLAKISLFVFFTYRDPCDRDGGMQGMR